MTDRLGSRVRLPEWSATKPSPEDAAPSTEEHGPIDLVFGRHRPLPKSTESTHVGDAEEVRVLRLPAFTTSGQQSGSFGAMQEWEGVVTEIEDDVFFADLYDVTAGEIESNETAEISVEDLQPEDVERLKIGAAFRWVVGYHKSFGGIRTRGFRIHFREPSVLDEHDEIPNLIFDQSADG